MLEFGAALPQLREIVDRHLDARGLSRNRVLAAAVRLIDLGFFRPGGKEYAAENGTYGLATILRDHVTCSPGQVTFDYLAKGSQQHEQVVADPKVCAVVRSMKRRDGGGDVQLAYRSEGGWHDVTASDINDYIREISGGEFTAKDFRTWHATVLAAVGLAVSDHAVGTDAARKRAVVRAVTEVAAYLGNTPAVARGSYIDPRVIEEFSRGRTVARALSELATRSEFGELAT